MRVIGITGGIGSGKSALLAAILENPRRKAVGADAVASQLIEPGGECFQAIIDLFGQSDSSGNRSLAAKHPILTPNDHIDKGYMAQAIFSDDNLRSAVNAIIHPAVKREILRQIAHHREKGDVDHFFIEAALLIEDGYAKIVDELWYVCADEQVRRERLRRFRGYDEEKAGGIMASQLPDAEYRKHCQVIITNNESSLESAISQAEHHLAAEK